MTPENLLQTFKEADDAVISALEKITDWGLANENSRAHDAQHGFDVVADQAVAEVLASSGISATLSEESGWVSNSIPNPNPDEPFDYKTLKDNEVLVVLDPVDGSSNASKGIPFYSLSICAIDNQGLLAAYTSNLATPDDPAYTATRGGGAKHGDQPISPSKTQSLNEAMVAVCFYGQEGIPEWLNQGRQFRAIGSAALEMCFVASGKLDIYFDCTSGIHAPWDYLAGVLICEEAGAKIGDAKGRNLLDLSMTTRRQPFAVGSVELYESISANIQNIQGA